MARNKSWALQKAEWWSGWAFIQVLRCLSWHAAEGLLYVVISAIVGMSHKRWPLMLNNLRQAFPNRSEVERENIARASLRNLARGAAVTVQLPDILIRQRLALEYHGMDLLDQARARGRGVIAVTAHYGCWELSSAAIAHRGYPVSAAYRPLDNVDLDRRLLLARESTGVRMIPRRQLLREALRHLRQNGILGILIDQHFADGLPVNFFGRRAMTVPIASMLARRTGAAILPIFTRWQGRTLEIRWQPEIPLSENADSKAAVHEDTQVMTRTIQSWIEEEPGQWLWLHNRWRG